MNALPLAIFPLLLGVGCGAGKTRRIEVLPPYSAEYAVIFDDTLAPGLFGFDPEGRDPARDPKLRDRSLRADLIVPARVETVSRVGGVESKGAYELALVVIGPPLYGRAPAAPIELVIGSGNPSYPWVDGAGARWVGTQLLLFGKRFRGASGDELHFRAEPDTPPVRAAVDRQLRRRVLPK